ncbi:MAG: hypothetical protein O3A00_25345 [Planctomycetota bacterium]|nr:hypothetical protein [Planctomycetota bacterium]
MQTVSRRLQRLNAERAANWAICAEHGDLIWSVDFIADEFFERLEAAGLPRVRTVSAPSRDLRACPWGWDSQVAQLVADFVSGDRPALDVVERVNSRRFSFGLECDLSTGLPWATQVDSIEDLAKAVRSIAREGCRWVAKAEFSMSARERIIGVGPQLSENESNWARRRLQHGGVLFVEPWVQILHEWGLQFEIPRLGSPAFLGLTRLLTDEAGRYCGSVVACDSGNDRQYHASLVEVAQQVADRIQRLGYFGPLGIDAVVYHDPSGRNAEPQLRPIQDINARYTMGRLCLGLRRLLQPGEQARWIHGPWPTSNATDDQSLTRELRSTEPTARLVIATTPFAVGHQPTQHGTWFVVEACPAPTRTTTGRRS